MAFRENIRILDVGIPMLPKRRHIERVIRRMQKLRKDFSISANIFLRNRPALDFPDFSAVDTAEAAAKK